jgi:hypothetical protein
MKEDNDQKPKSTLSQKIQDDLKEHQKKKRNRHSKTLSEARLKGHKFKKLAEFD